ncbi:hypothetical protein [Pontixanthobacter sp.]|uniref:hypothetical protein n=1 Tax=Pontixanthobacter sp. TaxID=2792078 RepID=UPI003C7CE2A6
MIWRALPIALLSILGRCETGPSDPQLIAIARPAMGGEALFRGTLTIPPGCPTEDIMRLHNVRKQ